MTHPENQTALNVSDAADWVARSLLRSLLYTRDTSVAKTYGATPRRIILAAVELFGAQGYQATSMRQVAERSGIQAASIYSHFDSKNALVGSALQWVLDDLVAFMTEPLTTEQPARDVLEIMVRRHALYQLLHPHRMDAWRLILESDSLGAYLSPDVRSAVHSRRQLLIELDEALLRAAFPESDTPRDRTRAVRTLCGRVQWWYEGDRSDPNAVADFIWSLALAIFTAP